MSEIDLFQKQISEMVNQLDTKLKNELSTLEKKCMNVNDEAKYVQCMEKTVEKVEKEKKNLEFRMAFLQYNTAECLRRYNEQKTDLDRCKEATRTSGSNYIDMFLFNIRQ